MFSLCAYPSVCGGVGGQIMQMCLEYEQGILQIRNVCQCVIKHPHGRLSGRGLSLCLSVPWLYLRLIKSALRNRIYFDYKSLPLEL